jgi:phage shock protein PspC (stress-responsive transcriptional regulator)
MPSQTTALPLRSDTVLGVCEAIGQDFGFHANWLRIAFALAFYWSPAGVISTYLTLGVLVLTSRLIVRDRPAAGARTIVTTPTANPEEGAEEMRLAA